MAIDGAHAWDAILSCRPDVVITDWIMPEMTGLQLCRAIRADASGSYIYIILVTSQGDRSARDGMTAGADDYLVKPLDPDNLRARLIAAARVTSWHHQLREQRADLERLNHHLGVLALRDPLTGLGNRRALEDDLGRLEGRVSRYGQRYCMALFDVDHFKSYNDSYGHPAGDHILQTVASTLEDHARAGDALYRYGGEEFLCVFPEQSLATGTLASQRMRAGVEGLAIPHTGNPNGLLTISAGVSVLEPGSARSPSEVLEDADEALYRAKQLGRNRVEHLAVRSG
jgi:diguanylate cyclase (GGDEF)-like protein